MPFELRNLWVLHRDAIVDAAREQARAGMPMRHNFETGSPQGKAFELAYTELRRELDALAAELV